MAKGISSKKASYQGDTHGVCNSCMASCRD